MNTNKVIIITGDKGEGKTTKLLNIIDLLKKENISIAGFTAQAEWIDGVRNKYTLHDVNSESAITLCTGYKIEGYYQHGRFYFNPQAIDCGINLLTTKYKSKSVIVIDEVGPFELKNKIWHDGLLYQLKNTANTILMSVREKLVCDVIEKFSLKTVIIYKLNEPNIKIINKIIPLK
ncbi:MAG: hypothetical protein H8E34_01535 [Bacteroidetes bacterium]|nr:hypothetical protein [Bacteroidota bacterium]MBL6943118.1 hypothetical protein [Bacteroidales bacterium]